MFGAATRALSGVFKCNGRHHPSYLLPAGRYQPKSTQKGPKLAVLFGISRRTHDKPSTTSQPTRSSDVTCSCIFTYFRINFNAFFESVSPALRSKFSPSFVISLCCANKYATASVARPHHMGSILRHRHLFRHASSGNGNARHMVPPCRQLDNTHPHQGRPSAPVLWPRHTHPVRVHHIAF